MKVAVIGSGVSGLAATWVLNEHSDHVVHLYEADSRPGGHANTVRFVPPGNTKRELEDGIDVDTGFIVMNPTTYPNFLRFLQLNAHPNVPSSPLAKLLSWINFFLSPAESAIHRPTSEDGKITILPTEMTFSVSRDDGAFEWAGKNLFTVFCQPRRLLDPEMWAMVYDVLRFNACARQVLLSHHQPGEEEMGIGDYLNKEGYSDAFSQNYLIPMTAAIWSTPPGKCFFDFPAKTLIQFMYNHHLLQITGKPSWLTIQGGSHNYVKRIISKLPPDQLHLGTPVTDVYTRQSSKSGGVPKVVVKAQAPGGQRLEEEYDHVIFACHSDTALKILQSGGTLTSDEERVLSMFEWNKNEVVLHSDVRMMPRTKIAWSCWNYLTSSGKNGQESIDRVSLTYGMNDLQHIPESKWGPVLATLNPPFEPAKDKVVGRWKYEHPVLDATAVKAQNEMYKIQNQRGITFAGAYLKYGFHEDGFTSGLLAACAIDEAPGVFPKLPTSSDSKSKDTPTSTLRQRDPMIVTGDVQVHGRAPDEGYIIPIQRKTVHPPFPIYHADHHTRLQREQTGISLEATLAWVFEFLQKSGIRSSVGVFGSMVLYVVGMLVGVGVGKL